MKNCEVRQALKEKHFRQWQLAILMGVSEQTMYRKLRSELPKEEQQRMIAIILENTKEG